MVEAICATDDVVTTDIPSIVGALVDTSCEMRSADLRVSISSKHSACRSFQPTASRYSGDVEFGISGESSEGGCAHRFSDDEFAPG